MKPLIEELPRHYQRSAPDAELQRVLSLLVEQAFVTNAEDVAALCEGDGIHAAARAYYRAICAYFGVSAAA